jgi:hypothetical protein
MIGQYIHDLQQAVARIDHRIQRQEHQLTEVLIVIQGHHQAEVRVHIKEVQVILVVVEVLVHPILVEQVEVQVAVAQAILVVVEVQVVVVQVAVLHILLVEEGKVNIS